MIKFEKYEVLGWEHAIRGMRNPMNSWDKSDSGWVQDDLDSGGDAIDYDFDNLMKKVIGPNDRELMMKLAKGGPVHAKYRRMIVVYVDITAPLYWWKEFDTYKVGTVANSCSTMHKIHAKEFTLDDFSCEHLFDTPESEYNDSMDVLKEVIDILNLYRGHFVRKPHRKDYWWQMIQLLPSSYNQKRTVMLNYEVLHNIYISRKNHKLDEWKEFCSWIEGLPYSEIITGPSLSDIPLANEILDEAKRRVIEDIREQLHKCAMPEGGIGVDIVELVAIDGVLDKIKGV